MLYALTELTNDLIMKRSTLTVLEGVKAMDEILGNDTTAITKSIKEAKAQVIEAEKKVAGFEFLISRGDI
jgi:hypothetical protein